MSLASETEARSRFLSGQEKRQLFARDTRDADAPLVFLPEGRARDFDARCAAGDLVCPDDLCDARAYVAVGGAKVRHHFRHRVDGAGGHGHEGYFHVVGKHLLAEWARAAVPGTTTSIEEHVAEAGRRADALATTPDGQRFALEVQYAQLEFEEWRQRDDDYRSAGIVPIWVFGHLRPHLVPGRGYVVPGEVWISALFEQILDAGRGPVLFLDPHRREIAQLLTRDDAEAIESVEPAMPTPYRPTNGLLGIAALAECTLTSDGMRSPWADRLQAGRERVEALERARLERERLERERRRAAEEAHRATLAARVAAQAAALQRQREAAAEAEAKARARRAAALKRVLEAAERTRALARIQNHRHKAISGRGPDLGGIPANVWRLLLYAEFVHGNVGQEVAGPDVYRHARRLLEGLDRGLYDRTVSDWLFALRALRLVDFVSLDELVVSTIKVLGDVDAPPAPDIAQPRSAMEVFRDGARHIAIDRDRGAIFAIDAHGKHTDTERCSPNALLADAPAPPPRSLAGAAWRALRRKERLTITPAWVTEELHTDVRIPGNPGDWHSAIWAEHVLGRVGQTRTWEDLMATMWDQGCGRSLFTEDALFGFLNHLKKRGAVDFGAQNARPTTPVEITHKVGSSPPYRESRLSTGRLGDR